MTHVAINAGDLDQRVTLQAPPAGRDGFGHRAGAWSDVATVWAAVWPIKGREWLAAGTMQSEATLRVRIRWRPAVTSDMRIVWRGQPYAIVGDPIDIGGARVVLELMCASGGRDAR